MTAINKAIKWIQLPTSIAPLVTFRVLFGIMMLLSTIRFSIKGWITTQYVDPVFHFTFMGFDWIRPLGSIGMHLVFLSIAVSSLFIALGFCYRFAIVIFFLLFTYVELIDVTYYLNHYYFISVVSFLMIWLPAGRFFSLDVKFNPALRVTEVPRWAVGSIRLQLGLVYFFAGLAKLNSDWLLAAQPMKIWLPTKSHLPLIGSLMYEEWMAYFFSWFGAVYDLFIVLFLLIRRTRFIGYLVVLIFHIATAIFFPAIGMFPYIMMVCTLVFFSGDFHLKLIRFFNHPISGVENKPASFKPVYQHRRLWMFGLFFLIQLILPIRYLAYPGPLFWTEEGYRFSWRVMLMEKVGTTIFSIRDSQTGNSYEVNNSEFLTTQQEKMMSTQPDLILKYAHYLADVYVRRGIKEPQVYGEVYVTLNGRRSAPFIDSKVNLADQQLSFKHYKWILPFNINHDL
ncbi:HTTM domain-containing protein [Pedobacter heparinus]|uniref:HTTM domain-containing protein n=1 Tax=Pedobacter heparinus TaxID=984 RepID=UPI002931A5ED|nr:HTTM domain-containing protein [Pedobacter heparinus]